jgi:hypothetical protein
MLLIRNKVFGFCIKSSMILISKGTLVPFFVLIFMLKSFPVSSAVSLEPLLSSLSTFSWPTSPIASKSF